MDRGGGLMEAGHAEKAGSAVVVAAARKAVLEKPQQTEADW